jgi:RimJ/RimL family protein N-acetyltransferase
LPRTEITEEKFIEELGDNKSRTYVIFVIDAVENSLQKPIGTTAFSGIDIKDHNATFDVTIGDKKFWSKGYGSEAARLMIRYGFEQLNLHRINSGVISFNERSIKMHNNLGFTEEGRQRQLIFKNGVFCDYVLFGLLRDEWLKLQDKT